MFWDTIVSEYHIQQISKWNIIATKDGKQDLGPCIGVKLQYCIIIRCNGHLWYGVATVYRCSMCICPAAPTVIVQHHIVYCIQSLRPLCSRQWVYRIPAMCAHSQLMDHNVASCCSGEMTTAMVKRSFTLALYSCAQMIRAGVAHPWIDTLAHRAWLEYH